MRIVLTPFDYQPEPIEDLELEIEIAQAAEEVECAKYERAILKAELQRMGAL